MFIRSSSGTPLHERRDWEIQPRALKRGSMRAARRADIGSLGKAPDAKRKRWLRASFFLQLQEEVRDNRRGHPHEAAE